MAVTVILPGLLRRLYGISTSRVLLPEAAPTLGAVIDALHFRYPGIRNRLCDQEGKLREHVCIFIGDQDAGRDPASTAVPDRAVIHIVPAISGGEAAAGRRCGGG